MSEQLEHMKQIMGILTLMLSACARVTVVRLTIVPSHDMCATYQTSRLQGFSTVGFC